MLHEIRDTIFEIPFTRYKVRNSLPEIAGVRMGLLYVIGFYILLIIIIWLVKKIGKFLETRRYRRYY